MLFDEVLDGVYAPNEYPALDALSREWAETRPFEGLHVLVATPIFRNTLLQYRALLAGGAILSVGRAASESAEANTSMPCDERIVDLLVDNDIPVLTLDDVMAKESEDEFFDLILDCAGQFALCSPRYGFVELTRSGVQFYEKVNAPVYVADSGIVKRIETSLGTGDGYFRALAQLGHIPESDVSTSSADPQKLLVFGSGKVGTGIALQGVNRAFEVHVVTDTSRRGFSNDFVNVLESNGVEVTDMHDMDAVTSLIEKCDFVVTATGVKGALDRPELVSALNSTKAILANMGVEDEYGANVPAERVLAEKMPLNFILDEPTHLKYIDASLALHAALGERMLQDVLGAEPPMGIKNPPSELEQRILMISIQNGVAGPEICGMLGLAEEV